MPVAEKTVLVLGDHDTSLSNLAERCRRLGHRTVRAKTPQDAILLSEERGFRFAVALVRPDLGVADLGAALAELRLRCHSEDMTAVATGTPALGPDRERLRRAGVQIALWEPIDDHALRFQLNLCQGAPHLDLLRGEERTPAGWKALVLSRGRARTAAIYSVSPGGAFLVTQRPMQKGTELAVELQLPDCPLAVGAEVVYANVPGNLRRSRLPDGMAIRFVDLTTDAGSRLRSELRDLANHFRV